MANEVQHSDLVCGLHVPRRQLTHEADEQDRGDDPSRPATMMNPFWSSSCLAILELESLLSRVTAEAAPRPIDEAITLNSNTANQMCTICPTARCFHVGSPGGALGSLPFQSSRHMK